MKPEALDQQRFALRRALFERLDWQVAGRDDPQVAAALATRAEVDAVYRLDQAGLLDVFMVKGFPFRYGNPGKMTPGPAKSLKGLPNTVRS